MFSKILAIVTVVCVSAAPNVDEKPTLEAAAKIMGNHCAKGIFSPTCLKIGIISLLEKANSKDQVTLLPGVSLVKDDNDVAKAEAVAAELAKSLPSNPDERLDKFLLYRLGTFLDTHSMKLRLLDEETVEETKSMLGEARARSPFKMGKKGDMSGLMAMGMMMKGLIITGKAEAVLVNDKKVLANYPTHEKLKRSNQLGYFNLNFNVKFEGKIY